MTKIRTGVLRGGISGEHDISLQTGEAVIKNLPSRYAPVDIVIDKYNAWHADGLPCAPHEVLHGVDVLFNALHGAYGEDGRIQNEYLDPFGVPYTGSGVFASALGMNKALAKETFRDHGLKTPYSFTIARGEASEERVRALYRGMFHPSVIKPSDGGSSLGVEITHDYFSFQNALKNVFAYSNTALIEMRIEGREATCGVIEDFRGKKLYALPPTQIIPPSDSGFFSYDVKYDGRTQEICPGHFTKGEKEQIMEMAKTAHAAIGARHYSRSDFIVSKRGVYILEINTLPGLTPESLLPKAVQAVGCSFPDFLDHVLTCALRR